MGWCSGSDIFYNTVEEIIDQMKLGKVSKEGAQAIIEVLYDEMKGMDWDCDEPYGVDWVDEIMGYLICETEGCDEQTSNYRDATLCWKCERDDKEDDIKYNL